MPTLWMLREVECECARDEQGRSFEIVIRDVKTLHSTADAARAAVSTRLSHLFEGGDCFSKAPPKGLHVRQAWAEDGTGEIKLWLLTKSDPPLDGDDGGDGGYAEPPAGAGMMDEADDPESSSGGEEEAEDDEESEEEEPAGAAEVVEMEEEEAGEDYDDDATSVQPPATFQQFGRMLEYPLTSEEGGLDARWLSLAITELAMDQPAADGPEPSHSFMHKAKLSTDWFKTQAEQAATLAASDAAARAWIQSEVEAEQRRTRAQKAYQRKWTREQARRAEFEAAFAARAKAAK